MSFGRVDWRLGLEVDGAWLRKVICVQTLFTRSLACLVAEYVDDGSSELFWIVDTNTDRFSLMSTNTGSDQPLKTCHLFGRSFTATAADDSGRLVQAGYERAENICFGSFYRRVWSHTWLTVPTRIVQVLVVRGAPDLIMFVTLHTVSVVNTVTKTIACTGGHTLRRYDIRDAHVDVKTGDIFVTGLGPGINELFLHRHNCPNWAIIGVQPWQGNDYRSKIFISDNFWGGTLLTKNQDGTSIDTCIYVWNKHPPFRPMKYIMQNCSIQPLVKNDTMYFLQSTPMESWTSLDLKNGDTHIGPIRKPFHWDRHPIRCIATHQFLIEHYHNLLIFTRIDSLSFSHTKNII
jgi:hypothetical protein